MFRTPPSSTSKEELKLLIRQILSSNSGVELIKKTSREDISSVLINNIINLLIDADKSNSDVYQEILSFFSSIQDNMGKQPYQTFVVELTAIMRSINTDKEDACDTIILDLLDPASALSRYEHCATDAVDLKVLEAPVGSAASVSPAGAGASEPVALEIDAPKTADECHKEASDALIKYLAIIEESDCFVRKYESSITTEYTLAPTLELPAAGPKNGIIYVEIIPGKINYYVSKFDNKKQLCIYESIDNDADYGTAIPKDAGELSLPAILAVLEKREHIYKADPIADETLLENFKNFLITTWPSKAAFEQSFESLTQRYHLDLCLKEPNKQVQAFIEKVNTHPAFRFAPNFIIPSIFGKFCSFAKDEMIKEIFCIIGEDDVAATKVRIIKLLGEILLKRAILGQELRTIEEAIAMSDNNREYTRIYLRNACKELKALAELESALQTEISVLSLPDESDVIQDEALPTFPPELGELVSTLGAEPHLDVLLTKTEEEEEEEKLDTIEQIKDSILNSLYPFIKDHKKIPGEQKATEKKLDTIFSESSHYIQALISCYKETSMARFSNSTAVYWRELIKCMDIISSGDAPIKLSGKKQYFFIDKRTTRTAFLSSSIWRVAFFLFSFSKELRNNKFLIMYLIARSSLYLLCASEQLRNDYNIVKFAVSSKAGTRRHVSGQSIMFAGDELRLRTDVYPELMQIALLDTPIADQFLQLQQTHPHSIDKHFEKMNNYIDSNNNEKAIETAILLFSLMTIYTEYLYMRHANASSSFEEKQSLLNAYTAMTDTMLQKWPKDPAFLALLTKNNKFNTECMALQRARNKWTVVPGASSESILSTPKPAPKIPPKDTKNNAPLATIAKSAPTSDHKENCSDIKARISAAATPTTSAHSSSPAAQSKPRIYKKSDSGFNIEGLQKCAAYYLEVSQGIFVTLETRNLAHKKLIIATALLDCEQGADLQRIFSKAILKLNSTPLSTGADPFTTADFFSAETTVFLKPEDLGITLLVDDSAPTQATTLSTTFWDLFKSTGGNGQNTGSMLSSRPGKTSIG